MLAFVSFSLGILILAFCSKFLDALHTEGNIKLGRCGKFLRNPNDIRWLTIIDKHR
jgi:hypothetical protein